EHGEQPGMDRPLLAGFEQIAGQRGAAQLGAVGLAPGLGLDERAAPLSQGLGLLFVAVDQVLDRIFDRWWGRKADEIDRKLAVENRVFKAERLEGLGERFADGRIRGLNGNGRGWSGASEPESVRLEGDRNGRHVL